jgi:hypothetical protein
VNIGMPALENSLWTLVALGGTWDVNDLLSQSMLSIDEIIGSDGNINKFDRI